MTEANDRAIISSPKKPLSRRSLIIGGSGILVAGTLAVTKASLIEKAAENVARLLNPDLGGSTFKSAHLAYTIDNFANWDTQSTLIPYKRYVDFLYLDPKRGDNSPQIQISAEKTDQAYTFDDYANSWASKTNIAPQTKFPNGPEMESEKSVILTSPYDTDQEYSYQTVLFIKNGILYSFCYKAPTAEFSADKHLETVSRMRNSFRIVGAPDIPEPLPNNSV